MIKILLMHSIDVLVELNSIDAVAVKSTEIFQKTNENASQDENLITKALDSNIIADLKEIIDIIKKIILNKK